MYSNNKSNENYGANLGASPKNIAFKNGFTFKQGNKKKQSNNNPRYANIGILEVNDARQTHQRRYNDNDNNPDRPHLGIIQAVRDEKHKQYNQNRHAHIGTINSGRPTNSRRYDGHKYDNYDSKRYNNYDRYNNYEGYKHNNYDGIRHNNYDDRRYDNRNRRGNQTRCDNYTRYEKREDRREDFQNGRDVRNYDKREHFQNGRAVESKMRQKKEVHTSKLQSVSRNHEFSVAAHTWRVVCDSMLGGLSSKLRMCGVDCAHVLFDQGGDDSAKLAMRENRILLTRNKNYERVKFAFIAILILALIDLLF